MFEPLRFLHVADAALDRPLGDLGPLSAPSQSLAEDATLTAFGQMIQGAIEHKLDFVLLAGNTFREADKSLRARLMLLEGLERLQEQDISVFVLPGIDDPASAWREISPLPGNVTILANDDEDDESATPIAVLREGQVIATVTWGQLHQLSEVDASASQDDADKPAPSPNGQPRTMPFRVGLLTGWPEESFETSEPQTLTDRLSACRCDYLAVPASHFTHHRRGWRFDAGQTLNTREGIAHHPGRLQSLSAAESGPHGATLIEVDNNGEIRGTFLPFASVRRQRFVLTVEPDASLEELTLAMQSALEEETPQPGEQAWFVTWIFQGSGAFFESLREETVHSTLREALPESLAEGPPLRLEHQFAFQESPPPMGQDESLPELERLYLESLEDFGSDHSSLVPELAREIHDFADTDWQERLLPLVEELDPQEILAAARSVGREWFRDPPED